MPMTPRGRSWRWRNCRRAGCDSRLRRLGALAGGTAKPRWGHADFLQGVGGSALRPQRAGFDGPCPRGMAGLAGAAWPLTRNWPWAGRWRGWARIQGADGAWLPLWFGNEHQADEANPVYGTATVLKYLTCLPGPDFADCGSPLHHGQGRPLPVDHGKGVRTARGVAEPVAGIPPSRKRPWPWKPSLPTPCRSGDPGLSAGSGRKLGGSAETHGGRHRFPTGPDRPLFCAALVLRKALSGDRLRCLRCAGCVSGWTGPSP